MDIIHVTEDNAKIWAELCNELWPHNSVEEMLDGFKNGEYKNEYIALIKNDPAAFISLSIRTDYVEGKEDSNPVGYLEGIYVKPQYRRKGVAKQLVEFAKKWSSQHGCSSIASDCELSNEESRAFHNRIGFKEVGINVHFISDIK